MKKLVELKEERRSHVEAMQRVLDTAKDESRDLTEDENAKWAERDQKVKALYKEIEMVERQEELNQTIVSGNIRNDEDGENKEMKREFNFGKALNEMLRGGNLTGFEKEVHQNAEKDMQRAGIATQPNALYIPTSMVMRADPYLSTSNTDVINKKVDNSLSVAKSDAQALLEELGVKMYTGLNGEFVAPAMDALDASFANEDSASSSFGVTTSGLKLSARRIGGNQAFTREFLNQSNPEIYNGILQDMSDAIWRAIAADLFDSFGRDAADASLGIEGTAIAYGDVLQLLKAKTGGRKGKFVAPQDVALELMEAETASGVGHIWTVNDTIRSYPAYMTEFANSGELYYGNWANAAVGMWGPGIEIIVDPYTSKNKAEIEIAINALADTGIVNSNSFKWIDDASIA